MQIINTVKDKNREIRSWDDAIRDINRQLEKCRDANREQELHFSIRVFEAAQRRGDQWPAMEVRA